MGFTIRTNEWRYTEWVDFVYNTSTPLWNTSKKYGVELYSHANDPTSSKANANANANAKANANANVISNSNVNVKIAPDFGALESFNDFENENLAGKPEHAQVQAELQQLLHSGPWKPDIKPRGLYEVV